MRTKHAKPAGALKVGDTIIGRDGWPVKVMRIYKPSSPNRIGFETTDLKSEQVHKSILISID